MFKIQVCMETKKEVNPIDYWYQKYLKEKLTWEDVKILFKIADNYESELNRPKYLTQDYCQEILNRFNYQRKK